MERVIDRDLSILMPGRREKIRYAIFFAALMATVHLFAALAPIPPDVALPRWYLISSKVALFLLGAAFVWATLSVWRPTIRSFSFLVRLYWLALTVWLVFGVAALFVHWIVTIGIANTMLGIFKCGADTALLRYKMMDSLEYRIADGQIDLAPDDRV